MNLALPSTEREFRMAASYRRCAWYVFAVEAAMLVFMILMKRQAVAKEPLAEIVLWSICAGGLVGSAWLLALVYRWRMRVDENGITRRRLTKWKSWNWEEFASGKLEYAMGRFRVNADTWKTRDLSFDYLEDADREFVMALCRKNFGPPPIEPVELVPGELVASLVLGKPLVFGPNGVARERGRRPFSYMWEQVAEVRLVTDDHLSGRLFLLELDLPNGKLKTSQINQLSGTALGQQSVLDQRAKMKVVEDFLRRHMPADKILRCAMHGPPESMRECDWRIERAQQELRWQAWLCWIFLPLLIGLPLVGFGPKLVRAWLGPPMFLHQGWLVLLTLVTLSFCVAMPAALMWVTVLKRKSIAAQISELERCKLGFAASS